MQKLWRYLLCNISDIFFLPSSYVPRRVGLQEVPEFIDSRHLNLALLSALGTGRLYPLRDISGTHFCYRMSGPQCHSAVWRIKSTKYHSDTIANRVHDLPLVAQCLNVIAHSRQNFFIITTSLFDSFKKIIPFLRLTKLLNFMIIYINYRAAEESITFETVSLFNSKLARYLPWPQLAREVEEVYAG